MTDTQTIGDNSGDTAHCFCVGTGRVQTSTSLVTVQGVSRRAMGRQCLPAHV